MDILCIYCVQQCVHSLAILALSVRTALFSKTSPPSSQIDPIVTDFRVLLYGFLIYIYFLRKTNSWMFGIYPQRLHVVPLRHMSILNCDSPQSTWRTGNTEVEWEAVNWCSFDLSLVAYYYIFYSYNKTWCVDVIYFAECTQTEQRVAEADACWIA